MKQKVLVTGANGYIGRNVINYLNELEKENKNEQK
mgnify:CR=1 FL=1